MKLRRVVSLTSTLTFIVLIITSVILYIVPQGRVAYWADWRLWGLTKTQWGDIHINTGVVFLAAICFHIYLNWKPLIAYLKGKAKRVRVFTADFNLALLIVAVVVTGTLVHVPPFSSIVQLNEAIKASAAVKYGEPPYGHAELSSLKNFTAKVGIDSGKAMERIAAAGIKVESAKQSLQEIARANNLSPRQVYQIMLSGNAKDKSGSLDDLLPVLPPPAIGRLTLDELAERYGLNTKAVLRQMEATGIKVSGDKTIKQLAAELEMAPKDLYLELRKAAAAK